MVGLLLLWRIVVVGFDAMRGPNDAAEPEAARSHSEAPLAAPALRDHLARNPADGLAMRQLARALDREGKRDEAGAAMRQALRLAPTDRQTLQQAADYFLRAGSNLHGLLVLRRLVDLYPADRDAVWPMFTKAAASGSTNDFFDGAARENPAWWQPFFRYACANAADPDGVRRRLMARVDAGVATDDDRRCVIARLERDGRWTDAYRLWLVTLPSTQRERVGALFNGGFEFPMSNLGFDWILPVQDGVTVDTPPIEGAGGRHALQVLFAGKRYAEPPVYQQLMLVPGAYRLEFRGRADGMDSSVGAQWGVYCMVPPVREPRPLMRSDRFIGSFDWMDFRYDFTVPKDCSVQVLRLELASPRRETAMPGTAAARLRGRLYFDDFTVRIRE